MEIMHEKNNRYDFDQNTGAPFDGIIQSEFGIKKSKVRKILRGIFKLLIIAPLILFVITVLLIVNSSQKLKTYSECTGTIIGFYETTDPGKFDSDAHKSVSPVVAYTVDGKDYQFTGNYYSTDMKMGQEIKVMYHNEDHSNATIKSGLYFAPIVTGALTLFFTLALVICAVLKRKGALWV